jgi:hypothetical protein
MLANLGDRGVNVLTVASELVTGVSEMQNPRAEPADAGYIAMGREIEEHDDRIR